MAAQRFACKPERERFKGYKCSAYGSHFIGVIAELAARKIYGGKIDQRLLPEGDGHQPDLLRRKDGQALEIKAVTFNGPEVMLKLNPEEVFQEMLYVLVQVSLPDICRILPPISGKMIAAIGKTRNFGHGDRITVTESQILENSDA